MNRAEFNLERELKIPGLILPVLSRYEHDLGVNLDAVSLRLYKDLGCRKIEDEHLTVEQFKLILDAILEQSDNEFTGLDLGKSFSFDFMYEVEMFLKTCKQVDQIAPVLVSLANGLMPLLSFSLVMKNSRGIIYIVVRERGILGERHAALLLDAVFSIFVSILSRVSEVAIDVDNISFCHRISLAGLKKYIAEFCCPVAPGGTVNSLHFSVKDDPGDQLADSPLQAQMKELMLQKISSFRRYDSVSGKVQTILETCASPLELSLADLASGIGVSSRTLQRKLREEGTSHREQVDLVLFERVTLLLHDRTVSLEDVASLLGYSSRKGLNRLVWRRCGMTPSAYRSHLINMDLLQECA